MNDPRRPNVRTFPRTVSRRGRLRIGMHLLLPQRLPDFGPGRGRGGNARGPGGRGDVLGCSRARSEIPRHPHRCSQHGTMGCSIVEPDWTGSKRPRRKTQDSGWREDVPGRAHQILEAQACANRGDVQMPHHCITLLLSLLRVDMLGARGTVRTACCPLIFRPRRLKRDAAAGLHSPLRDGAVRDGRRAARACRCAVRAPRYVLLRRSAGQAGSERKIDAHFDRVEARP
ncbi:hypothetical protein DFJ74DRAFT_532869 [Hyaloraphidium curvatum]|nr:hypothetical protein DFJ74DRAFT_532869 [Hyaloraphidium curvatum]